MTWDVDVVVSHKRPPNQPVIANSQRISYRLVCGHASIRYLANLFSDFFKHFL